MKRKVFNVGFARTGTTSFGAAMRLLGYRHQGPDMDLFHRFTLGQTIEQDARETIEAHDSFDDWPWSLLYNWLPMHYPDALFVMTDRDEESWVASYRRMIEAPRKHTGRTDDLRQHLFGTPMPTDEQLLATYRLHRRNVLRTFEGAGNFQRLSWMEGDGWDELCAFLDEPLPDEPFPYENRSEVVV